MPGDSCYEWRLVCLLGTLAQGNGSAGEGEWAADADGGQCVLLIANQLLSAGSGHVHCQNNREDASNEKKATRNRWQGG